MLPFLYSKLMSKENIEIFINKLAESLREETFVKMTLGNYNGKDVHLQKIILRLIKIKKGIRLFFLYKYNTRDTAKNYNFNEGVRIAGSLLGTEFFSGHLFTIKNDFQLDIGKKGKSRLNTAKPTFLTKPNLDHDKNKKRLINPNSFYLNALGIMNDNGVVRSKQQDKWKQINKFVETLGRLFEKSNLKDRKEIKITDMGSGKGYLTFATYDFFKNNLGLDVTVTGVDTKSQLVELCNDISKANEFEGLKFTCGDIGSFDLPETDILIALHACNTATDEAMFKGIHANADLIVVAPCCHQEIRRQIVPPEMFEHVLKHGILREREAESITDGLRSLLLEKSGYSTRVFEFISTEHTPKNNMIVGQLNENQKFTGKIEREIEQIKEFYGIKHQRLEQLINAAHL